MKNTLTSPRKDQDQVLKENGSGERTYLCPAVNIFETKDNFVLEAEMPGVNKDGLEITLEGNALTLVGHRNESSGETEPIYRESKPAHFRRVFELDPALDATKINASMDQGILTLNLPKAERVKPRKIQVG